MLSVPDNQEYISRRLSRATPDATSTARIDSLIKECSVHWKELLGQDPNTLETALSMMDTSSIGKARYQKNFHDLQEQQRRTLKSYVDLNYQGFNSAVGSYRVVVQSVGDSQVQVGHVKDLLKQARQDLGTRRPALKEQRQTSLRYKEMIDILDKVEELKSVPDVLESQIAQKHFLSAHETLQNAIQLSDTSDLQQIPALNHIHSYISSQETQLFNILVDELSNHLYLKSPYTDALWNSYSIGRNKISNLEEIVEDKIRFDLFKESASAYSSYLNDFLTNFDKSEPLAEDPKKNAESDSYYYIRLVVETLGRMNRLTSAFAALNRRLSTELHRLIEKTVSEVRSRIPKGYVDPLKTQTINICRDFDDANSQARLSVLQDLFWTLYSKMIAVLQAHRVIHEVVNGINWRRTSNGKLRDVDIQEYDMLGIYRVIEGTLESLIHSYISVRDSKLQSSNISPTQGRSKSRLLFQFDRVDYNRSIYQEEYDEFQSALEQSVPGLINLSRGVSKSKTMQLSSLNISSAHELLVRPVIFNIRVILEPTVVFMQRSRALLPYDEKQLHALKNTNFLDQFMSNLFLPELESALRSSYEDIVSSPDSFISDPQWVRESKKPIVRAAPEFFRLIQTACHLLSTGYMFREKYAATITSTIASLAQNLEEKYNEIVEMQDEDNLGSRRRRKLAAILIQDDETIKEFGKRLHRDQTKKDHDQALRNEAKAYASRRHSQKSVSGGVSMADLLDIDSYYSLSVMATSIRWLVLKLEKIRKVKDNHDKPTVKDSENENLHAEVRRRWTLLEATRAGAYSDATEGSAALPSGAAALILTGQSLENFDNAIKELESFIDLCVTTLRTDLRLRTIYYLDLVFTQGDYYLENDNEERDASIGALDTAIMKCDEYISETLTTADKEFVFSGMSALMNELLVKESDSLELINHHGITKMKYNVLALQQMLKSIVLDPNEVDFTRAIKFYNYAELPPPKLLELVKSKPSSLDSDDFKVLNKLIYSSIIRQHEDAGRKEAVVSAKNAFLDQQMKIHNLLWGNM